MNGRVIAVPSADTLIILDSSSKRERKEIKLSLAYVNASARVQNPGNAARAFDLREQLRKLLIGKPVKYKIIYSVNGRDYGDVSCPLFDSLIIKAIGDGLVTLRDDAPAKSGWNEYAKAASEAQLSAEAARIGIHEHQVRSLEILNELPSKFYGKQGIFGLIEGVLSGERVIIRAILEPEIHFLGPVSLAFIRSPRSAHKEMSAEPFGEEAKNLLSQRLLHRDVMIDFLPPIPDGVPLANIWHSAGDIAKSLVLNGFATVNVKMPLTPNLKNRIDTLRDAQMTAQEARRGIWSLAPKKVESSKFEALVVRVASSDTIGVIAESEPSVEKVYQLSSIRAPKKADDPELAAEARDFVRRMVIGRPVTISIDGERPPQNGFSSRILITAMLEGQNLALKIVQSGYASAVHHRHDDQQRSPQYDDIVLAENEARASKRGIFSLGNKKSKSSHSLVDASESTVRARGYLGSLQRRRNVPGIIDHIINASRLRVIIPSENCVITVVHAGIHVPRLNEFENAEEVLKKANLYLLKFFNQRDITLNVFSVDKTGAFACSIRSPEAGDLARNLVERGFASVHEPSARNIGASDHLFAAETAARTEKMGIWEHYTEEKERNITISVDPTAEVPSLTDQDVIVTAIDMTRLWYYPASKKQVMSDVAGQLSALLSAGVGERGAEKLRRRLRKDNFVAVKTSSGYARGQVEALHRTKTGVEYNVRLIDIGTRSIIDESQIYQLPESVDTSKLPAIARTKTLAYISIPPRDYQQLFQRHLEDLLLRAPVVVTEEGDDVIVFDSSSRDLKSSVNAHLVTEGYTYTRNGRRTEANECFDAMQNAAKSEHRIMWEYGDPRSFD